jgi:hypothetical protein
LIEKYTGQQMKIEFPAPSRTGRAAADRSTTVAVVKFGQAPRSGRLGAAAGFAADLPPDLPTAAFGDAGQQ